MQIVSKRTMLREFVSVILSAVMAFFGVTPGIAVADGPGSVVRTPDVPMELPIEVEIELSPAGSLKQAALWKELYQLLKNPYALRAQRTIPRRPTTRATTAPRRSRGGPGFGASMPPLKIYSPGYNFLTGQPLRLRTSDGEVSWDQPGPLFDPDEEVATDAFNTPTELRTVIGHLVACPDEPEPDYQAAAVPATSATASPPAASSSTTRAATRRSRRNGTVVAVAAFVNGQLRGRRGRADHGARGSRSTRRTSSGHGTQYAMCPPRCGPTSAGSGPRSSARRCSGTCRSAATASRPAARATSTPASTTARATSSTRTPTAIADQRASRSLARPTRPTWMWSPATSPSTRARRTDLDDDANDVMSSMGVSRSSSSSTSRRSASPTSSPPSNGVRALAPDSGNAVPDPIPVMQGVRRVEPRNTPTMHGAAFNFDNFWDGRARFNFNGGSVFGPSDPTPHIFINPALNTGGDGFTGATMGHLRPELEDEEEFDRRSPSSRSGSSSRASPRRRWARRSATSRCRSRAATGPRSARSCCRETPGRSRTRATAHRSSR